MLLDGCHPALLSVSTNWPDEVFKRENHCVAQGQSSHRLNSQDKQPVVPSRIPVLLHHR
jgi:hypothetical protein